MSNILDHKSWPHRRGVLASVGLGRFVPSTLRITPLLFPVVFTRLLLLKCRVFAFLLWPEYILVWDLSNCWCNISGCCSRLYWVGFLQGRWPEDVWGSLSRSHRCCKRMFGSTTLLGALFFFLFKVVVHKPLKPSNVCSMNAIEGPCLKLLMHMHTNSC